MDPANVRKHFHLSVTDRGGFLSYVCISEMRPYAGLACGQDGTRKQAHQENIVDDQKSKERVKAEGSSKML